MAGSGTHDLSRGERAGQTCLQTGPEWWHGDGLALPVFCRSTRWTSPEQQSSLTNNWNFASDYASDTSIVARRMGSEETLRSQAAANASGMATADSCADRLCVGSSLYG